MGVEGRVVFAEGWGRRGYRVSNREWGIRFFGGDTNVLRLDYREGCIL